MFKKRAVMRSYLDLANNAYIADANFHYTECGMAKLLQEYCHNKALYEYKTLGWIVNSPVYWLTMTCNE